MSKDDTAQQPQELNDEALQQAQGGVLISLLLPAVQKAGEAARRSTKPDGSSTESLSGDGSV